ncbi:MAG: hypothetical protein HY653_00865 [Acidobacteria bacterium]|nr:hypothetical protein [Acidobacteriota bacterium]
MRTYLLGPILVLLPQTYRDRLGRRLEIDWTRAALISGVAQAGAAMLLLAHRYIEFIQRAIERYGAAMVEATGDPEALRRTLATLGPATWLDYVFQPVSLLLIYLFLEGSARLLAAVSVEQAWGSLPLCLLELGRKRGAEIRRERARERAMGALILDEVTRSGNGLRIASCRPRDTWDHLTTIEYEGEFYELAQTLVGLPPRPYIYRLRPIPAGKVIRGLHHYSPDELLARKTPDK